MAPRTCCVEKSANSNRTDSELTCFFFASFLYSYLLTGMKGVLLFNFNTSTNLVGHTYIFCLWEVEAGGLWVWLKHGRYNRNLLEIKQQQWNKQNQTKMNFIFSLRSIKTPKSSLCFLALIKFMLPIFINFMLTLSYKITKYCHGSLEWRISTREEK